MLRSSWFDMPRSVRRRPVQLPGHRSEIAIRSSRKLGRQAAVQRPRTFRPNDGGRAERAASEECDRERRVSVSRAGQFRTNDRGGPQPPRTGPPGIAVEDVSRAHVGAHRLSVALRIPFACWERAKARSLHRAARHYLVSDTEQGGGRRDVSPRVKERLRLIARRTHEQDRSGRP